jgi:two-component system OmpR family response regulator
MLLRGRAILNYVRAELETPMALPHILVVDDDHEIRKLLGRYLVEQGFRATLAADGREFRARLEADRYDMAIIDVLLPDASGLELCRHVRQTMPRLPVILVTALKEEVDRIIGLELGADDYIGKPFNPRELVARIRAVLRRSAVAPPPTASPETVYRFGGLVAIPASRSVTTEDGTDVGLTGAEFELLCVFLARPGRVLSRDQLLELTQGRESSPFGRSIDVLISRLRRKLGDASGDQVMFKTVRNGGYQLTVPVFRDGGG